MMKEGKQLNIYMDYVLNIYGNTQFQQLLFKWFPIWYYDTKRRKQLDFLATPLLFAYVVKQDSNLIDLFCSHESVEKQLKIVHPHNNQMNVRDILFSYYSLHPKKMVIRPPIQKIIYVCAPSVSQHFWHFMMGEFLPVVSEILKHTPQKVYLIKEHYSTCPFNAFYDELPFQLQIIHNEKTVPDSQKVQSPLYWNMFNYGEQHKLVLAVEFLKEWVDTTKNKKTQILQKPKTINTPNTTIVQERVNIRKLDHWYSTDYLHAQHELPSKNEHDLHQYGAKIRHITNLIDVFKQLKNKKKNS